LPLPLLAEVSAAIINYRCFVLMTWKRLYRHFEKHECENSITFRQMERFIMTSGGRISGKATCVRVAMYHVASIHFSLKTIPYKQNINFTEKLW